LNALLTLIRTLGPARLGAIGALTAVILGMVVYAGARISEPTMVPLFTDLDVQDSAAIVRELESQNIPFELRQDGTAILAPEAEVPRLRMQLAESGLPTGGGVGYEIFDKSDGLGATSFVQNLNRLRALEGELARTIRTIDRVRMARVHLVLPERKLFSQEQAEPSASIVLKLRGSLERGQIKAIQHLVASAVKDLKPSGVSIVDDRGELLASGNGSDTAVLDDSFDERRNALESQLRAQVESIVSSVVGPGNARIQVVAELDMNRVTETQDVFDPDGQVVRSTQSREENASATDSKKDAGVSAGNQLPSAAPSSGPDGASHENNAKTEEIVNYEISKRTLTRVHEAGGIKRLSVAVLVDGLYTQDGNGQATYAPRPQEQLDQIATLVRSAIGFDSQRGDVVQVVNLRFAPPAAPPVSDSGEGMLNLTKADYFRIGELVTLGLVGLILVLFVARPLLRSVLSPGTAPMPLPAGGEAAPPMPAGPALQPAAAPAALPAPRASPPQPSFDIGEVIDVAKLTGSMQENSVRKVAELVHGHPDEAAAIMRQWMQESA